MKPKLVLVIIVILLVSGCQTYRYSYHQDSILDYKEPHEYKEIRQNVFPSTERIELPCSVIWSGLLKEYEWDVKTNNASFLVEHRYLIVVPYPLDSTLLALAGHPDFFYLSEKSEGQFISQVKMQRELTENELLDFKHQKYALTLVGDLEIENDIILLKVSYMEKIPLEGIIEVVVEKD